MSAAGSVSRVIVAIRHASRQPLLSVKLALSLNKHAQSLTLIYLRQTEVYSGTCDKVQTKCSHHLLTVNNNTINGALKGIEYMRSGTVYHVDSSCQCIHRQHKSTMLSLHCFSYMNYFYHPPLLQLCEPSLSTFSYVDQIPPRLLTSTSIYAIKLQDSVLFIQICFDGIQQT